MIGRSPARIERADVSAGDRGGRHVPSRIPSTALSYAAYAEIPADGNRWEFLDGEVYVTETYFH